ncbi:hypothetical protein [Streptomyces sp. NPDC093544]|uniref:zinc finger domain-containing protein n=1 Tax=Streptomyces sp. NPDC093544 TaxID=3155200 RepID=UPI0034173191
MIHTPSSDVLTDACDEARRRFAARVPEPRPEDFPCRWCHAPVGRPCVMRVSGRTGPHRPRGDRWTRAHDAWHLARERACDDAVNVLHDLADVLAS